jgi:CCR4-NOT transcriptional regulation complex NOT5 subunit
MANRKATFAKRQRETDLKDRAKAKGERRANKRVEVRDVKGPQIALDEAVQAVVTDETAVTDMPSLETANQDASHSVPVNEYPPFGYGPRR